MKRGEYKAECAKEFMAILLESGIKQPDVMEIDTKRMAQYAMEAAENLTAMLYDNNYRIALTDKEITCIEKQVLHGILEMSLVTLLQRERTPGNKNLVTTARNVLIANNLGDIHLKDAVLKQEYEYTKLAGFGTGSKIVLRDMFGKYGLHFGMTKKEVTQLIGVDLWTGSPVYPDLDEE